MALFRPGLGRWKKESSGDIDISPICAVRRMGVLHMILLGRGVNKFLSTFRISPGPPHLRNVPGTSHFFSSNGSWLIAIRPTEGNRSVENSSSCTVIFKSSFKFEAYRNLNSGPRLLPECTYLIIVFLPTPVPISAFTSTLSPCFSQLRFRSPPYIRTFFISTSLLFYFGTPIRVPLYRVHLHRCYSTGTTWMIPRNLQVS